MTAALVLANRDYQNHVTDEGEQLQEGLREAGWTLAGFGYDDGCIDVPSLLDRHQPRIVLVSAREDWDERSEGCFDRRCSFRRIDALAARSDVFKVAIVKDSPGPVDRRRRWCQEIKADAILLYYHPTSMVAVSPWLRDYPLIRTWHSVDAGVCLPLLENGPPRSAAVVSGAKSTAYPLRSLAFQHASQIGLSTMLHPGYRQRCCHTPEYLKSLAAYKVHIATASVYGFALRKIVESVAVGCVPITDLPEFDTLPEIDGALVRIRSSATIRDFRRIVQQQVDGYDSEQRIEWVRKCLAFYDWRTRGKDLSEKLLGLLPSAR